MPRKSPKLSRDQQLVRAVKSRALIFGYMGKPNQLPQTIHDLMSNIPELVDTYKHTPTSIDAVVRQMTKNKQLIRLEDTKPFAYRMPNGIESLENPAAPPKEKKVKSPKVSEMPVLNATFIKATGRVRFQIQGMIIEFGVE